MGNACQTKCHHLVLIRQRRKGFRDIVFNATIRHQMQPGENSHQHSTAQVFDISHLDGALDRKIMTT